MKPSRIAILICLSALIGCAAPSRADLGVEGELAFNDHRHCFVEDCALGPLMTTGTLTGVIAQPHTKAGQARYSFSGQTNRVESSDETVALVSARDCNETWCLVLELQALRAGVARVSVFDSADRFVDAIDVEVHDPAVIEFATEYSNSEIAPLQELTFSMYEHPDVWMIPFDADGMRLTATRGFTLHIDDPSQISVGNCTAPCELLDHLFSLRASTAGTSSIEVTVADASGTLPLIVTP